MQIEFTISNLKPTQRRRSELVKEHPAVAPAVETIVLAYQFEQAVRNGRFRNYADVARQIGLTRARVSQVMRVLNFSPTFLENLLLNATQGSQLTERQLRPLVGCEPNLQSGKIASHN